VVGGDQVIFARLKLWAMGLGLVVAALAASWFGGRKSAQADAKQEELEGYVETRKRMDEIGRMSDADAARDWLKDRAKR
jgi:dienelactone hydrolase